LNHPSLFNLSESEEEYARALDSSIEQGDYLYGVAGSKGWARVRIAGEDVFIDVDRSAGTHRFLSKVAQVIADYGVPYNTIVCVEIFEGNAKFTTSTESLSSLLTSRFSIRSGLLNLQAKWVQGLLTKEEAIEELVKTGKSRELACKILDSWGTRFSSYTPLHSGGRDAIFSMANDNLIGRDAFFGSLAVTLRKRYNLPNGSSSYSSDKKHWAFYDGVVNDSNIRFVVKFVSFGRYLYEFNLNGIERSGEIKDLREIRRILP